MQKINVSYTMVFTDEIFAKLLEESGLSNASEMVGFLKATILTQENAYVKIQDLKVTIPSPAPENLVKN